MEIDMDSPLSRPIDSRSAFQTAVREAFAAAAAEGARELWLVDRDFADWPLSEPPVVEHLRQWARAHRKLTLIAETYDEVARRHARWSEWRRVWSHIVECRSNSELDRGQMPSLLLATGLLCVRLDDPVHHRGSVSRESADQVRCREQIDALLQRSVETFPVTMLGL
jgi:hypothetical protein